MMLWNAVMGGMMIHCKVVCCANFRILPVFISFLSLSLSLSCSEQHISAAEPALLSVGKQRRDTSVKRMSRDISAHDEGILI